MQNVWPIKILISVLKGLNYHVLLYAKKYRNTFEETLESEHEYHYLSLGIIRKKEVRKRRIKSLKYLKYREELRHNTFRILQSNYS